MNVIPHLVVKNAPAAIEFYQAAFGADNPFTLKGPNGTIIHACVALGQSRIFLVEEIPEMKAVGPRGETSPVTLHLEVDNVDELYARAIAAGARQVMPPTDMFWGDRYGVLVDPFGHHWSLATHIEQVDTAEIQRRALEPAPKGCVAPAQV